jgi:hypothetical protein
LFDIVRPKPEQWRMDGWFDYTPAPVGMEACVSWSEATGLSPDDLSRFALSQCHMYLIAASRLHGLLWAKRDEVVQQLLEECLAACSVLS